MGPVEIVIGGLKRLPPDIAVASVSPGLLLRNVLPLGEGTIRLDGLVEPGHPRAGFTLKAQGAEASFVLEVGDSPPPLALPANLPEEAATSGVVTTPRPFFLYAFEPAGGVELTSLRIFNGATGRWVFLDETPRFPPLEGPSMDADSDGDGRPDLDDPDLAAAPVPVRFLAVPLVPGANALKIVSFSRAGRSREEALTVSYEPPPPPEGR